MEESQFIQSPQIRKISNSTIQFRQLIQSLRRNSHRQSEVHEPTTLPLSSKQQASLQQTNIPETVEIKMNTHNNYLILNQSESRLKAKEKMEVGDRDKLKKKQGLFDQNPQISKSLSRSKKELKIQASVQAEENSSKQMIALEVSPMKNASTQCQGFQIIPSNHFSLTNQLSQISTPRQKTGLIVRQKLAVQQAPAPASAPGKLIRDINDLTVLQYVQKERRMNEKSDPSELFNFFTNLCLSCGIVIKSPSIKKYKNCVYYGYPIKKEEVYEGFLYFYDGKIYYGQFLNGYKHGLGVQINLSDNSKAKGQFKDGHKTGKFYIERPTQKYIGYLENGLYQGQGRLTTDDYVYEGLFQQGEKNGYGEEFYPKTGVKMSGIFKNGVLQRTKISKSIPQIKSKSKVMPSKEKEKQRLERIRQKSLDKHNERMTKIRSHRQKESQYEMQFDATEQYQEPIKIITQKPSKLEMYRQPLQKLPKICQQFEYSFEQGKNFESISSHNEFSRRALPKRKQQFVLGDINQRVGTAQLEQPLPTPCLTVYKRRR